MDFEIRESPEIKAFRREVSDWLDENLDADFPAHADPRDVTYEDFLRTREMGKKLGEKRWLWATASREYGGGGLSLEHGFVIDDELNNRDLSNPPYYDPGSRYGGPVLMVWGTEEQKRKWLPDMFSGKLVGWQLFTEPGAGSDLYSLKTTAVRDGDHYIMNGQKAFVGTAYDVDYWVILVRTNPEGERYKNLGWFHMPATLPGISRSFMNLLWTDGTGGVSNIVTFDNVKVPAECLVGGENNGYDVSLSWAELEHGVSGNIRPNRMMRRLIRHVASEKVNGRALRDDPDVRDQLADTFIHAEINRLFGMRNYWMSRAGQPISYEGPQSSFMRKMSGLNISENILRMLGPKALTFDSELDTSDGHFETDQRSSICALHPGATEDVQRVIMARRIGIGREVREQPGKLTGLVTPAD